MTEPRPDGRRPDDGGEHPRGTLVVVGAFVLTLAALWTLVYVIMLIRGTAS